MMRLLGGLLFLAGAGVMAFNLFKTVGGKRTVLVLPPVAQVAI
jgi:cbb3-type cytochrome oxidase subunit 1